MANDKDKKVNQPAPEDDENDQGDSQEKETKDKNKKSKLTRVVFNKSYTPYVQGEMAGLVPELAEKLIQDKICTKA